MDPHIPLLCCCDSCNTIFVAFSNEFVFCRHDCVNQDYTKIYGHNRIMAGNWIYFKGSPKPGIVKSFFQGPTKEIVVVNYDGGPDQKFEHPKVVIEQEDAPGGYRLLPAQSAHTLLGDHIYHAIRNKFGMAVGFVNDGEKDKLVVLLEDEMLVFITLPTLAQNLPNDKLCSVVQNKLAQVFPEHYDKISVEAGQGIIFLKGLVRNLSVQWAIQKCVNAIPKVRGCVDFTRIQVSPFITDVHIENAVYSLLESIEPRLFDNQVHSKGGKVLVETCCYENERPKDLENRISEIEGVRDLICLVNEVTEPLNVELCKEAEEEISSNVILQDSLIRISCNQHKFLLEGYVHSSVQKQWAFIALLRKIRTTAIENRLRII